MYNFECSGKTISEAIESGLKQLKLNNTDVDIKILQNAGFLKKAKVLLIVPTEIEEKSEVIANLKLIEQIKTKINKDEQKITENTFEQNSVIKVLNENIVIEETLQNADKTSLLTLAQKFITGLVKNAGFEIKNITAEETDKDISIKIFGEKTGKLIGKRGETLSAIQYLTNVFLSKFSHNAKRVILDIDGYKEKRNEVLVHLAHTLAKKVQETQKPAITRPMNSYERRIIHNVISKYIELETQSEGQEPNRYIVIKLK